MNVDRTNEDILSTEDSKLSGLDKQRKFLLRMAIQVSPCPVCGDDCSLLEAAGVALNDYALGGVGEPSFRCPANECGVELRQAIPLFVLGGGHWFWMRKHAKNGPQK